MALLPTLGWAQDKAEDAKEEPAAAVEESVEEPEQKAMDPAKVRSNSAYGLGYRAGREFASQYSGYGITEEDLDNDALVKGFLAGFTGQEPELNDEQIGMALEALGDIVQNREKELAESNLKAGFFNTFFYISDKLSRK